MDRRERIAAARERAHAAAAVAAEKRLVMNTVDAMCDGEPDTRRVFELCVAAYSDAVAAYGSAVRAYEEVFEDE